MIVESSAPQASDLEVPDTASVLMAMRLLRVGTVSAMVQRARRDRRVGNGVEMVG